MTIKLNGSTGRSGERLSKRMLAVYGGAAVVLVGGMGLLVYAMRTEAAPAASMSPEAEKLAARAANQQALSRGDGERLRQREVGENFQFDAQGQLIGATGDDSDVPKNRYLAQVGPQAPSPALAEISQGVRRPRHDGYSYGGGSEAPRPEVDRSVLTESMLAYTTVRSATWAGRRTEVSPASAGVPQERDRPVGQDGEERVLRSIERLSQAAAEGGSVETVASGPSRAGDALYPALGTPQGFSRGELGDMKIGPGPVHIVRQGKFLDCALVNELKVDLVESPVVAMVARDFLTLDGSSVLVPAGAKLLGTAGTVQNVQQARVYIKFDRILFPDQRSAYFPVRQVGAVDGMGAVGIPGDVNRHFWLQFGSAVVLGMLDGFAAAVQTPNAVGSPTARDLVLARTSNNFSSVLAGILNRYANVVPTVSVPPGSKLKVFFAEDVQMSAYMASADLRWLRRP